MIRGIIDWWKGLTVVETACFNYGDADKLIRKNIGWRLSPMEDSSFVTRTVWLERVEGKNRKPSLDESLKNRG